MRYLYALMIVLSCPLARAQWMTIATNGQSVSVSTGLLVRYGSVTDNLWTYKQYLTPKTYTVGGGEFPVSPDPNAPKSTLVLQAYQLPIAQTVTVSGQTTAIPVNTAAPNGPTPAAQPGTPAYCNTGRATTATPSITINAKTQTITSASLPCS
jgi:hypothetical protein